MRGPRGGRPPRLRERRPHALGQGGATQGRQPPRRGTLLRPEAVRPDPLPLRPVSLQEAPRRDVRVGRHVPPRHRRPGGDVHAVDRGGRLHGRRAGALRLLPPLLRPARLERGGPRLRGAVPRAAAGRGARLAGRGRAVPHRRPQQPEQALLRGHRLGRQPANPRQGVGHRRPGEQRLGREPLQLEEGPRVRREGVRRDGPGKAAALGEGVALARRDDAPPRRHDVGPARAQRLAPLGLFVSRGTLRPRRPPPLRPVRDAQRRKRSSSPRRVARSPTSPFETHRRSSSTPSPISRTRASSRPTRSRARTP